MRRISGWTEVRRSDDKGAARRGGKSRAIARPSLYQSRLFDRPVFQTTPTNSQIAIRPRVSRFATPTTMTYDSRIAATIHESHHDQNHDTFHRVGCLGQPQGGSSHAVSLIEDHVVGALGEEVCSAAGRAGPEGRSAAGCAGSAGTPGPQGRVGSQNKTPRSKRAEP